MKHRLTSALFILFGLVGLARPARAQFLGYTSPQTVQQVLANQATCNGGNQNYPVENLGQTQHYVTVTTSGSIPVTFSAVITGVDASGTSTTISDTLQFLNGTASTTSLTGSGYYPKVVITVQCTSGTYTLNYSGTSATFNTIAGGYQIAQIEKILENGAASNASAQTFTQPPFSNTSGTLFFRGTGAPPANSTLTVDCLNSVGFVFDIFTFTLAAASGNQVFNVPPSVCTSVQIVYTSGGASANTYFLTYLFNQPGYLNATLGAYTHITGTTATAVKGTAGTLLGINLNTSGAGTISVFDLVAASCTGTPATNVVAVLTIAATENARSIPFNDALLNGICVKASAGMDFTVSSN
jgi:hypothetical protein